MASGMSRDFRLRACQRCGGDAHLDVLDVLDEPEWRCLQCGRPVPAQAAPTRLPVTEAGQRAA